MPCGADIGPSSSREILMGRGVRNRMDLRRQAEAAERRDDEDQRDEGEEDEEEEEGDEDSEPSDEAGGEEEEAEEEEEAPKKKKPAPKTTKPRSRSRTAKHVRMKVVWGVFSNSNQRVATYEYKQRPEADAHARKLSEEKKSTFFVQPVKEAMEDKSDE
jgi:hypothetical protein